MSMVSVRRAEEGDLEAISELFLAAWRTSYRGVLPTQLVDRMDVASARHLWRRCLTPGAERTVRVAMDVSGSIVGVVAWGRDPDDHASGHVYSLYVHPAAQGHRIGSRLLTEAVISLAAEGLRRATLWVFEANTPARTFYARSGWKPAPGRRIEPEFGEPEIQLMRTIGGGRHTSGRRTSA